jgi:hypothetical protein
VILVYLLARHFLVERPDKNNLYFNISAPDGEAAFSQINEVLLEHVTAAELRRLDTTPENVQATYLIKCEDDAALAALLDGLRGRFPRGEFTFVEQDNTLGA